MINSSMFFFSLQWRRFLLTRKLLAKAPCWNFPKRGGDAGLLVERGGEREERKGLSPPLSLPFPRYFSPNREPVLPPPPHPHPLSLLFPCYFSPNREPIHRRGDMGQGMGSLRIQPVFVRWRSTRYCTWFGQPPSSSFDTGWCTYL